MGKCFGLSGNVSIRVGKRALGIFIGNQLRAGVVGAKNCVTSGHANLTSSQPVEPSLSAIYGS